MLTGVSLPDRSVLTDRATAFAFPRIPWTMRVLNRLPRSVSRRLWPLDPEALRNAARTRSGLTDFGDGPEFDTPFEILCRSFDSEALLNASGRMNANFQLVGNLASRLRLEDLVKRHPEVLAERVPRPVFVTGAPRTGTTFLHRLIARGPGWRTIPFWEVLNPLPAAGASRSQDVAGRIASARRALRMVYLISPDLIDLHEMSLTEPDEEIPILAISHCSSLYECMALLPEYVRWYAAADHTAGYQVFKRFLQAMQWSGGEGGRWALKAPSHLEMLRPLLTVFDDATILQTHRDPVVSVISLSSLMSYGTRINFDHPNPHLIGRFAANFVERLLRSAVDNRDPADKRFVDVWFRDLVADPIGEARRIYGALGHDLTQDTERAMTEYARRQSERAGKHRYAAADFALDVAALRERFGFYYQRFDVPIETV